MDRNFILAGSFAAALHGALFTFPGGPSTTRIADPKPTIELKRPSFDIPDEPPDVVNVATTPSGGVPNPEPRTIEEPKFNPRGGIEIPIERYEPTRVKPGNVITSGRFGPGGDISVLEGPSGLVGFKHLDRTPRARVQIPPEYPREARREGRAGTVLVEFLVDEGGRVYEAHAVNTTDRVFNDAAVRAVSKWRFEPGTVHGKVVRFRMAVPVVFHLET